MRIAVLLVAGLAVLTGVLQAQSSNDEDDEMDYFPLAPTGNLLRFGWRYIGGPKVTFGHLGAVPTNASIGDATTVGSRSYNDGYVVLDTRKSATGNPVNDGLTNSWNYQFDSQVTPGGDIAFHTYNTSSLGAAVRGKITSAAGWELQVGHRFGRIGRKIEFSLVGGFSFSDLAAKRGGIIQAQLNTTTDVYALNGQAAPTAPYTAPTFSNQPVYDANGNPVFNADGSLSSQSIESTTLLGNLPNRTTTAAVKDIKGHWEIKGAYYTFRAGPMFQFPLTERLKLSFGTGVAVIYVGSRYIVQETLDLEDSTTTIATSEEQDRGVILPAYYVDADAEYWLTERAGFFLGANYQKSRSFEQTLSDRTANVDLSTTYAVQSGITLRF